MAKVRSVRCLSCPRADWPLAKRGCIPALSRAAMAKGAAGAGATIPAALGVEP